MDNGRILILTGPPGSGKSTIADLLASSWETPSVHFHTDDFYAAVKSGFIQPWLPESHPQNVIIISAIVAASLAYAKGGYFVVVDGFIGPWFLDAFRNIEVPVQYLVLRPSLETARRRAMTRGHGLDDFDVLTNLYHSFATLGDFEAHVIDNDGLSLDETVARVVAATDSGTFNI